jgi:RHS repeat-associated protein
LRAGCAGNRVRSFYRGEQYDSDLGLYYLRARYYNPSTGRFLSRDPEDGNEFDPKTLHKYLYAGGDPVNGIDPRGRADLVDYAIVSSGVVFLDAVLWKMNKALAKTVICAEITLLAVVATLPNPIASAGAGATGALLCSWLFPPPQPPGWTQF